MVQRNYGLNKLKCIPRDIVLLQCQRTSDIQESQYHSIVLYKTTLGRNISGKLANKLQYFACPGISNEKIKTCFFDMRIKYALSNTNNSTASNICLHF